MKNNENRKGKKMAQVRQNRTAGQLLPYGFEVRTQHQLGSVLHHMQLKFLPYKGLCESTFPTNNDTFAR